MKKKEKLFFCQLITAGDEACEISEKKAMCACMLIFQHKPELGLILQGNNSISVLQSKMGYSNF